MSQSLLHVEEATVLPSRTSGERRRLLEREDALNELAAMLHPVGRSSFGIAIVEGERGTGKTALLNSICHQSMDDGMRILRARGCEQEHARPLGIMRQVIAQIQPISPQGDQIRQRFQRARSDGSRDPELFELFQDIDDLLIRLAVESNIVIAIDDAQDADRGSLEWVHFLSQRLESRPIALLLSALPRRHVLTEQPLDAILSDATPRRIELRPLSPESVSRLVLKRFGEPAVAAGLDTVCAEATRGNPALLFALFNDLEQHVDKTDPTGLAAHVPTASPSRLVHSIAHLASTVGPDSLIILQAIALLDSPAEVRDIAEVSAVDPRIISPTLERLTEVGILEAAEPIRFVHPLVKSALIGAISVSRRRSLHMRCAKVLLRKGHPEAAIAAHVVETEPVGDRNSTRILLAGCRHEIQEGDLTRAERMLSRAEAEAPELRDDPALLIEVAEMHARLGHPEALDYLRRAEHATPNPAQLLPILFALADAPGAPELATVLERLSGACRRIDLDSHSRTQVDLARCLVPDPQAAGAVRALQLAQVDDPPLMHALRAIQAVADPRGARAADLSAVIEKHVQPSDLSSADPVAAHIGHRAVIALTRTGHSDVAERLVAEASEASAACNGATAAGLLRLRALIGLRRGNIELARACLDRADRHNPSAGWSLATTEVNVAASLSAMQGDTDSAMAMLSDFELGPLDVDAHLIPEGIGWLALLSEQFDLAVMSFSDAASLAERDGVRGTAATSWRAGAARALAATDDLRAARELATESVSISRSFGAPGPLTLSLGAMAATGLGDPLELLAEAVESADRSQEPLLALRSRLELGIALHNEGYDAKAIEVLRVAGDAAHKLGVPTISEAVIAGLRACGSRPVRLAIQGIEALTPAQLRVVRLAAGGATNAEIATTLFINIKTVESHLARAFRKLGVRSRNELPALLDA